MQHFICEGECKGVSDTPTTCGSGICTKKGHEFMTCDCEDGLHGKEPVETPAEM